jgi:hypothetical protein
LFLFLFVFVVAWDYFGVGIWEFAYTSYSWGVWSPADSTRAPHASTSWRRHFRASLHTFGGDDPGASSILVVFCFFRYTKERRRNGRTNSFKTTNDERTDEFIQNDERRATDGWTDGRIRSKRWTTIDERTDGFICGVSTVWSFVRWLIDRRRSSVVDVDTQSVVGRRRRRRRRTAALTAMSVIIHPSRSLNRSWDCTYITSISTSKFRLEIN